MDRKIAGLLGAAAALTTMTAAAQASPAQPTEPATATSYSDLLNPVANAGPLLQADNARRAAEQNTQVAEISVSIGHRHHHHHHVRVIRHHHHHFVHHHH